MFKRILLPLDGSHNAERAIPIALRLAHVHSGTIILLRVVNSNWSASTQASFTQDLPAHARFEAEKYLVTLKKRKEFQGIQVEIQVPTGNEASTILATAEQQKADIILINSHGYSGLSRWIMGSVAEKITRYSEAPVLLLRDQSILPIGPHPDATQPLRILVPLDGSNYAETALEPAAELIYALTTPAKNAIHLVRVIDTTDTILQARLYLQTIATKLQHGETAPIIAHQQIPVNWSIVVSRDAADAIIHVAEDGKDTENSGVLGDCDIITMSTHGITGSPLWKLGSTTERVRTGTRLPLLIIRPAAMAKLQEIHHQFEPGVAVSESNSCGDIANADNVGPYKGSHILFQRILVPLDGSPQSEQALALAAHIARVNHSSIYLLRSIELMSPYSVQTIGMRERIQQFEEQGARNYLDHFKHSVLLERIPTETHVSIEIASSAILDAVTRENIDLVILCSRGYTSLKHWVLGSVAQKIARACPVPVLIQRDEHPLPFMVHDAEQPIFRVCIALDGSPQAEAVIEPAISIAAACAPLQQAEIHLLRIIEPLNPSDEDAFKEIYQLDLQEIIHQQVQTYLQDVSKRLEPIARSYAGIKIIGSLRNSADIAQEIMQYAEKGHTNHDPSYQLLAMTTHGRNAIDRWIFGSIAERVLNRTKLPLLIVRPPQ